MRTNHWEKCKQISQHLHDSILDWNRKTDAEISKKAAEVGCKSKEMERSDSLLPHPPVKEIERNSLVILCKILLIGIHCQLNLHLFTTKQDGRLLEFFNGSSE